MKIITLAQQKGGVGKTSVCINLACQAIAHGKSAVILDMDVEQGSSIKWRARRNKKDGLEKPEVFSIKHPELERKLAELKARGMEWVFIDLPGRAAYGKGLSIADLIIVPSRPVEDDIEPSLFTVGLIRRGGRKNYAYLMNICPPQVDRGGNSRARKIADALRLGGHPVSPVIIVQRLAVPDANARGLGVNEYEPDSPSAAEYGQLFEWIESELR
jgi:chromosome partitioning protein